MEHLIVLAVQCMISLFVFYTLIRWYIHPRLSKQNFSGVLSFLLIINVFRYLPLSLFMPGQVSDLFPQYLKGVVAYGDLASAMLAPGQPFFSAPGKSSGPPNGLVVFDGKCAGYGHRAQSGHVRKGIST